MTPTDRTEPEALATECERAFAIIGELRAAGDRLSDKGMAGAEDLLRRSAATIRRLEAEIDAERNGRHVAEAALTAVRAERDALAERVEALEEGGDEALALVVEAYKTTGHLLAFLGRIRRQVMNVEPGLGVEIMNAIENRGKLDAAPTRGGEYG